ncbi:MAG: hypothetical protein AAFY88_13970 [Acidobacteriota bacterium]
MSFNATIEQFYNQSAVVSWICTPNDSITEAAESGSVKNGYWATENGVKKSLSYNITKETDEPILIATGAGTYILYYYKADDDTHTVQIDELASGNKVTASSSTDIDSVQYELEIDGSGEPTLERL